METSPMKRGVAVATKAQVALFKIIAVISTVRPPLNLDLNSEPDAGEVEDEEAISTAESATKTTITAETSVNVDQEVEVEDSGGGYLHVLLEAIDEVEEEKNNNRKRKAAAAAVEPAVVRTRRGRSQCLPVRFRDSVLEPWAKLPAVHRH